MLFYSLMYCNVEEDLTPIRFVFSPYEYQGEEEGLSWPLPRLRSPRCKIQTQQVQ